MGVKTLDEAVALVLRFVGESILDDPDTRRELDTLATSPSRLMAQGTPADEINPPVLADLRTITAML